MYSHTTHKIQRQKEYTMLPSHPYLDDLPFLERQLLNSRVRVGGHGERVVIKQSHKYPRVVLQLRLIVVWRAAAASTVTICNERQTQLLLL